MKYIVNKQFVLDEDNRIMAVLSDDSTTEFQKTIEFASEAKEKITEFLNGVKEGTFSPKKMVKALEEIVNKN